MKIERKYMAHYLNAAFGSGDASYTRLGSDLEEYSPELTANVEKKSNIVGETTVTINGYQKQGEVSPYYAEPGTRCLSVCRPSSTAIWCWMT